MTKENARLYLPLVQALAEGKVIQILQHGSDGPVWVACAPGPQFTSLPEAYRIKPEPKTVPLGPEDVPPGSVMRGSGETDSDGWCLITSCSRTGIRIWRRCGPDNQTEITWKELKDSDSQIKRPGGEWEACSKQVSE